MLADTQGTAYSGAVSGVSDLTPSAYPLPGHGLGAIAAESEENPPTVTPDNLAYVIYTSGSTGSPGVCSSPSCEPLGAQHKLRQLRTKDVVAFVSNCSFDAATFEIWEHYFTGLGWVRDVVLRPGLCSPTASKESACCS